MYRLAARAATALIALALTQCGGSADPPPEPPTPEPATVGCRDAILDRTDPQWREESTAVGPFGLYGPDRGFDNAWRSPDGDLITKIPAIVEGQVPVTVRVLQDQPNRVLLHYGDHRPSEALTFQPCDQALTSWPGGLVLETRQPATLEVQAGDDSPETLRVGGSS